MSFASLLGVVRLGRAARMVAVLCVALAVATGFPSAAKASQILTGATSFFEPDGGVSAPGFSGSLAYELFDSGGGLSALAGGAAAPTLGTDFTLIFQVQMDPDTLNPTGITDVKMSAFQLGPGDGVLLVSPGPSSGGPIGSSDPVFSFGTFNQFADFSFAGLPGGGLAEGDSSAAFFFTIPDVDLTSTGSTLFPTGDVFTVGFFGVEANSVDIQVHLEQPTVIPEPAGVWLLGAGLLLLAFASFRPRALPQGRGRTRGASGHRKRSS
ncbi:MAG: hypothetical protein HRU00_16220 [Myxococcales bacterium]|nr:hypothetical protein [Myxococcales bacterium]